MQLMIRQQACCLVIGGEKTIKSLARYTSSSTCYILKVASTITDSVNQMGSDVLFFRGGKE